MAVSYTHLDVYKRQVQDVHISLACIGFLPERIIAEMLTHASKSRTA